MQKLWNAEFRSSLYGMSLQTRNFCITQKASENMEDKTQLTNRESFKRYLLNMFIIFCFLNFIDWINTIYFISLNAFEINLIFRYLATFNELGFLMILVWKVFLCMMLYMIGKTWVEHPILFYDRRYQKIFSIIPKIGCIMYVIVISFMWLQVIFL
jgi:hypothetical protein